MKIGNIQLSSPYIFPAVAGYSDVAMRVLCYRYGAGLCYTEMVSAKGLVYGSENSELLLQTDEAEKIKAVQLFGSDPAFIQKAIVDSRIQKFQIIDLNMGCPVPKIVKNGEGSALMKFPEKAYEIIKAACEVASGKPVTVKMRAGFDMANLNAPKISELAEKAGASAVIIHGRVRDQFYSGEVNLDIIKEVKKSIGIPVFGNGNVINKLTAEKMIAYTGCDGVAVARAAIGKPYIFSILMGNEINFNVYDLAKEHFEKLSSYIPERVAINNMKKHLLCYVKGQKGAKELKNLITNMRKTQDFFEIIEKGQDLLSK